MDNSYQFEVYQTLRLRPFLIYFYTNYFSPCLIRWLKYSEIFRVTGATGMVGAAFPYEGGLHILSFVKPDQ
jgi:hypothetical protein